MAHVPASQLDSLCPLCASDPSGMPSTEALLLADKHHKKNKSTAPIGAGPPGFFSNCDISKVAGGFSPPVKRQTKNDKATGVELPEFHRKQGQMKLGRAPLGQKIEQVWCYRRISLI